MFHVRKVAKVGKLDPRASSCLGSREVCGKARPRGVPKDPRGSESLANLHPLTLPRHLLTSTLVYHLKQGILLLNTSNMKTRYTLFFTSLVLISYTSLHSQNVGIGNTSPAEKLDVSGNVKADTVKAGVLRINANAGDGKVLTSDGNGNGSWEALTQEGSSDSDNVGYGVWGDCEITGNLTGYQPVADSMGAYLDLMGYSVSISGNYAIIGAPSANDTYDDQGSASIYYYNGTQWEFVQKIFDPEPETFALFGYSVDIAGNFAIIGAFRDDGTYSDQGSACIFQLVGNSWEFMQRLEDPQTLGSYRFGYSVALTSTYAVVGSTSDDYVLTDQGSVCIFQFNGSTWEFMTKVYDDTPVNLEEFGTSVAISGERLVVGVPRDIVSGVQKGSAFVFNYDGANWQYSANLIDGDGLANDGFGQSVSISGNEILIGAPFDDKNYQNQGSAVLWRFNGTTWLYIVKLYEPGGYTDSQFGVSTCISGNYLLIGANQATGGAGSAILFQRMGTGWQKRQYISDPSWPNTNQFGYSSCIDSSTNWFVIGAPTFPGGKAVFGKVK